MDTTNEQFSAYVFKKKKKKCFHSVAQPFPTCALVFTLCWTFKGDLHGSV